MKGRGRKNDRMTSRLTKLAKTLRKNATHVEALLWQKLKTRQSPYPYKH
jgi:very-short-patch-repair endonuclease